jgi:hypothetical protein
MSTISSERNDIFNPEYRKKKNFLRKSNVYRMIFISAIVALFIYGSRDFIFGKIMYIEVRNMKFKPVDSIIIPLNDTTGYFFINRNPFDIKLVIPKISGLVSNYNNSIVGYNDFIYVSFTSTLKSNMVINIGGVKVG